MSATLQFGKVLLAFVLMVPCAIAQTPTAPSGADRAAPSPATASPAQTGYTPMTQNERLRYYFSHMFSVESVVKSAAAAGINQALNTPSEWGQGGDGYGRRFASSYGLHIVQSTVMYGISAPLHEDNRYFQSGLTGTGPRLKYAIASTFLARHDDGSRHFSISRIASFAAAAGISRSWQPPSTSGAVNAADSFGLFVGAEAGFNIVREFLPRIFHSNPPVVANAVP